MANKSEQKPTATPAPSQHPTPTPSTTPNKSEDSRTLEQLEKEEEELHAKIAALAEAKKNKLTSEASVAFESIKASAIKFRDYLSSDKKQELVSAILGPGAIPESTSKGGKGGKGAKGGSKTDVEPQYEVNGRQWSGRGKPPREFAEWAETAEGKAYQKQHSIKGKKAWPPIAK
ncbi:hypothetical protein [Stenotrophomonas maltophilia]|uniref:hypothetical protein n=1 Tax=Stenotrophomonas maltophilia TaxID=40324 RepID=UPI00066CC1BE|nr:hypothetical protein [Stenotrophomonas maltophilia]